MSFKVGDRVKIPKGVEGTVRYVGKVTFSSGTHVGVELDEPAGDNNGKKKGKVYFKCKKKHGIIEKTAYFTAVRGRSGGKRKSISSKSSKKGGRASKAPVNLTAITDEPEEKQSKKGKKGKKDKHRDTTPIPQIVTETKGIQTDVPKDMLAYVESEYFCKIITRLYTEENEKLRKQRDDAVSHTISLQQRTDTAEARAKQLEYEIKQQSVELDPLREELEMKEVEIEELSIKCEIANIEIEELNDKLEESLDSYVEKIGSDNKEHAELVTMNQELQQQLQTLVKVGQELLDTKDKHINKLATESDYVESLAARLKDLLSVEQEVLGLKTSVQQLSDKCTMLEDADRMCQQLTDYNNTLEGELTDWREWVLDVEAERKILEELHEDDDKCIGDLMKDKKDLEIHLITMDKENKQLVIEKQDLEKEIFELRNKMQRQDVSAAKDFEKYNFTPTDTDASTVGSNPTDDAATANGDYVMIDTGMNPTDEQEQKQKQSGNTSSDKRLEALWTENLKLTDQMDQLRSILMHQIDESVHAQGRYVEYELMKQYLPAHSSDVDYKGISVMALLQKILYKAKAARDLLERFYGEPSSALLKNPDLAMMSHTLCPIILSQENYIRAIQRGFLSIKPEEDEAWKQKVLRVETPKFNKIIDTYDALLKAIDTAGKSNELSFEIDKLANHEKVLKNFVEKQFVDFSPDKPKTEEHRCRKNIVLQNVSETHYRFQSLSIKLNQFNAKLFDLVYAPAQTTRVAKAHNIIDDDEKKYDENAQEAQAQAHVDYEEDVEDVLKILKIGAIEKLFRLRNDVVSGTQQILKFCQPVEMGFSKEKYSANLLKDSNQTAIKWSQLKQCKHISFKSVQRVSQMLEKLNEQVKAMYLPRKRVDLINKIIEDEEEHNEEGLIRVLEKAYGIIGDVRKIIGSTLHTTISNTDEMGDRKYDQFSIPFWENKSAKFRVLFEQQKESQDKIHEQEGVIKQNDATVAQIEKELKQKIQTIDILTEQNIKEKGKSSRLADIEKANNALSGKNEKFKSDILKYTAQISDQSEEIAAKSTAIEKYKKAISRIKEKESPLGKTQGTLSTQISATHVDHGKDSRDKQTVGGYARHGTLLVDNEVEYSSLLQQTIQSLRRKVTQLTISKKVINCELKLKPLPFTLLRDKIIQNLHDEIQKRKQNKKKKRVKKQKEEEKEDGNEEDIESEYEWITDEEQEEEDEKINNERMIELNKLKQEQEMAENVSSALNILGSSLDNIRSQPLVIDLTRKKRRNDDLGQEIIARQIRLRDIHCKYQEIRNKIKKNQNKPNENEMENNKKEKELGHIWGEIEIPNSSLKSLGYDGKHRVLLPSQQVDKLQNSFLW